MSNRLTFTEADYATGERAILKEISEGTALPHAHHIAKVVLDAVANERAKKSEEEETWQKLTETGLEPQLFPSIPEAWKKK